MAPNLSRALGRMEVQSMDLPLLGAVPEGPARVDLSDNRWILPLIASALDRTMARKEAAILLGIDASLMTRQLSGDGHLSALRLGSLPEGFWVALIDELRGYFKLDDPAARTKQAMELISRGMAMLVAEAQR